MTCYYRLISYGRPTSSDGSGAGPLIDGLTDERRGGRRRFGAGRSDGHRAALRHVPEAGSCVNAAFMAPRATTALPPMIAANTLAFLRLVELISKPLLGAMVRRMWSSSERPSTVRTLVLRCELARRPPRPKHHFTAVPPPISYPVPMRNPTGAT